VDLGARGGGGLPPGPTSPRAHWIGPEARGLVEGSAYPLMSHKRGAQRALLSVLSITGKKWFVVLILNSTKKIGNSLKTQV